MRLTVVRLNVPSVTALSRAPCCWTAPPMMCTCNHGTTSQ
jgi:hypothetical protein